MLIVRVPTPRGSASVSFLRRKDIRKVDEYDLLIEGICHQAAKDLKSKNDRWRFDAMDFFRSKWFEYLTDLDGEEIIQKLLS